jgi:hypothetical protein
MKYTKHNLIETITCILCAALAWKFGAARDGTEFSSGRLTGSLLHLEEIGTLFFTIAIPMIFIYRRVANIVTMTACLLCLPVYLYALMPGLVRRVFHGEYSVPLHGSVYWDTWAVIGTISLLVAFSIHITNLLIRRGSQQHPD